MPRLMLRNDQYSRIEAMLPGKASDVGVTAKNNRLFVEAVLWVARTGSPWRDLPTTFCLGTACTSGSRGGPNAGVWHLIFPCNILSD